MKKIFFALAALVLAFTGCSQEEDAIQVSEKKAIKVVVNMDKPGFGEDTRAARQGWVEDDQVVVMLDDDFEHLIALTYNGTGWEETVFSFDPSCGEWDVVDEAEGYLADLTNGSLKAIYCSSGISYLAPIPEDATAAAQLTGIDIISYARDNAYYDEDSDEYIPNPLGECIMTCKDGDYSVSGDVLTLNITMIPQVAQFTIKDLKIADNWNVYAFGPFNRYAGGTITSAGVEITPLSSFGDFYCHDNEDGISFYVAPWQSVEDMPEDFDGVYNENYYFDVYDDDYVVLAQRMFPFTQVEIGDAVIFDGPYTVDEDGEPTAGAQAWVTE